MVDMKIIKMRTTDPWFKADSKWPRWIRYFEFLIRTKIFRQERYLIDVWTIEDAQKMECWYGLDLEEELTKALTEEIEKEIKENGSYTWEELCEMDKNKAPN